MPELTIGHVRASLAEYGDVTIPYWEVQSSSDGPVLLLTAAQHGCEVQGCEAMRRLLDVARQDLLRGTVLGVPFANKPALWKRRHHISSGPERPYSDADGHNMNLTWPGSEDGNDTERLSRAIYRSLGERATHAVDIHCWTRFTAATCLPRVDRPGSMELAAVSALPFAAPRGGPAMTEAGPKIPTTVGAMFNDTGRVSLTVELSGQYVIVPREVEWGLRCLLNVARFLGMLPGEPEGTDEGPVWLNTATVETVAAPRSGLFVETGLMTCDWVEEGQPLGHIICDDDLSVTPILSPIAGRLSSYGCRRDDCDVSLAAMHPYASEGDVLATVASPN